MVVLNISNIILLFVCSLIIIYQIIFAIASFLIRRKKIEVENYFKYHRFAILIPAHNEELLLGNTIDNLKKINYPSDLTDIIVIADNCWDRTAEIAKKKRVVCLERFDKKQSVKDLL